MLPIWCWVILLGVFFSDATVTLLRRVRRGERWYEAHRSHAYQNLARRMNSHALVTLAALAIDLLWLLPCAYAAARWPSWAFTIALLALTPLVGLVWYLDAGGSSARH